MSLLARVLVLSVAMAPWVPVLPASAQERAPDGPFVLVVDPGRARVSPERLLRVIATAVGRDVVRITDPRARDSAGTLTIAYEGTATWLVRFDARGRSASSQERIARPGALDATLAAAAARMIATVDAERAAEAATPTRPRDDESFYISWADEILDPFAGAPPQRRELAIYSEVIDPFAPPAARRAAWSEVLDPWGR